MNNKYIQKLLQILHVTKAVYQYNLHILENSKRSEIFKIQVYIKYLMMKFHDTYFSRCSRI